MAQGYAAARPGGKVEESEVDLGNTFNAGRDAQRLTPREFAMNAAKQAQGLGKLKGSELANMAKEFAASLGNEARDMPDFWQDEAGRERIANFLTSLGFNSIKLDEDGTDTYGLLKHRG